MYNHIAIMKIFLENHYQLLDLDKFNVSAIKQGLLCSNRF